MATVELRMEIAPGLDEQIEVAKGSTLALLAAASEAGDAGSELVELLSQGSVDGLCVVDRQGHVDAASGTFRVQVTVLPSEALLKAVAAFAGDGERYVTRFDHGWPFLFPVVVAADRVAEGGAVSSRPAGGEAA